MAVDLFYRQFDVVVIDAYGNVTPAGNADIEFYNVTQATTIDTITADDDGIVPAGGFDSGVDPVAAGDIIELRSDGTKTRQFMLSASAEAAELDPNAVVTYVAEDLATDREAYELVEVYLKDLAQPDKKPVYLGDAPSDGSRVRFPYQTAVAQDVELIFNPKASTVKAEFVDPSQRVSESLSIPASSGGFRALYDRAEDAPTLTTDPEILYEDTIPAGTLGADHDKILAEYYLKCGPTANSKSFYFLAFGHTFTDTSHSGANTVIEIEITMLRVSNTTVRAVMTGILGGNVVVPQYAEITGLDLAANDYTVQLYGETPSVAGDIVAKMAHAEFIPAALVPPPMPSVIAETGAFSYSGANAGLYHGRRLDAQNGSFSYSGADATLTHAAFTNWALASNGSTASASSTSTDGVGSEAWGAGRTIDGTRHTNNNWNSLSTPGGGWQSAGNPASSPEWVEIDFGASRSITRLDMITLADAVNYTSDPTLSDTFTSFGVTDFKFQYWNGSSWVDVGGTSVTGNDKVWRQFSGLSITTTKIRLYITAVLAGTARVVEIEAWG